ncbi:MAG TPA: PEP-CTERM sorting domain-containing protein [Polyangiaceae bacterium LLY-WYZ-14_1]|nr:PEP-CTERM sorting domain-containing protein [Polyangiaceae bacterium LLY-WYZ-14_1]
MNQRFRFLGCGIAAALFSLFAAGEAHAQTSFTPGDPACSLGTVTSGGVGYTSCWGSFGGNLGNPASIADAETNLTSWVGMEATWIGKTDAGSAGGPFQSFANSSSGSIFFDAPVTSPFAVALKGGPRFSLYYFAGMGAWTSVEYDMLGVGSNGASGPGLSNASLFVFESDEVVTPEPGTMALLLLGLAGLGFVAWRREGVVTA